MGGLIAELFRRYIPLSRTVTPRRTYDTYNARYTHGLTVTTRRRGDARIKRCCRHRPGGVEGTRIREKAPREGVWMGDGGRARAAAGRGQGACSGTERRGRVAAGGGGGKSGVGARAPERARRRGRQVDHRTYEETEQTPNAMGMGRHE